MQRSITPPVGPISARHCCRETPPPWPPWPAAQRIVFASIAAIDIYLDRMRLADLFLDSYPYNAAATCNDALRAGFPFSPMLGNLCQPEGGKPVGSRRAFGTRYG